jgi:hypothetical protein
MKPHPDPRAEPHRNALAGRGKRFAVVVEEHVQERQRHADGGALHGAPEQAAARNRHD